MKVLTKRQILLLHSALIRQSGGSDGIRDEGLLDSAVSTPFQTFADQELYPLSVGEGRPAGVWIDLQPPVYRRQQADRYARDAGLSGHQPDHIVL